MDVDEGEVSDSEGDGCIRPSGDTCEGEGTVENALSLPAKEEIQKKDDCVQFGTEGVNICDRKRPVGVGAEEELSEGEVSEEDMESSRPKLYKLDLREFVNASTIDIPEGLTEETPLQEAAGRIARCIREPKVGLIKDVLATIGFKRTMEVLHEAKVVQETGGMETRDGHKPKRSAGGVFLTLLKNHASSEEVKQVYAREKAITKKKKAHMVERVSLKGKRKRKQKRKQDSKCLDRGQEEMDESKHRKVPDRRELISYADLTDTQSSQVPTVVTSHEQASLEESSTATGSVAVVGMATVGSEGGSLEETRLAEDFDTKDTPDGLDGLEFDWY